MSRGWCHSQIAGSGGDTCSVAHCDGPKRSDGVACLLHKEYLLA